MPKSTPPTRSAIGLHTAVWLALLTACTGELDGFPAPPVSGSDSADGAGRDVDFGPDFGPGADCDIRALMALPENGCTTAGCHGAQFQGGLDLASPGVAQRLNGVTSNSEACGGELLIDPQDLDNSLLLRVIDPERFKEASCGVRMPLGSSEGVSAKTLSCFEAWAKDLASAEPTTPIEVLPEFEPVPAQSYVNKVKTLLTGQAATPSEVASVLADDGALRTMITSWVETPEYSSKLFDFLKIALQQRIEGSLDTQFMRLRGNKVPALRSNLEESFIRTAAAIVQEGRPFQEVFTTRRWAVTTATLAALAFLEKTPAALRAEKHTLIGGAGVSSISEHKWYLPNLPAGCVVSTIGSDDVLELMLGFAGCKGAAGYRFDDTVLTAADFADWRFVDLEAGLSSATSPIFYDVVSLRSATKVSLVQPRMGFFTSPAFLANWETNEDNQFRVTTSQTLIVALGEIFSPADPTIPVRLDGLATEHVDPATTCYGCHQFLDPMREYFAHNFSFTYQATATPSTVTPSFAFRGYVRDGGSLQSFATTLGKHPKFATGWTQKLCYWANSQACNEADPEFQRVAAAFAASGFNFKALLVELLSSPLVTGASFTETYRAKDPFISITRRQHLCQLLDTRLGVPNACDVAASFAGLVPEDAFNRGSAEPVQASVTGLFHYAAAEKLCLRLATRLVSTATTARFQTKDAELALDALVTDLMGLGVGHPRHDEVRARLAAHFEAAKPMGGATIALRSAFTVACVSPEVMAVGL